LYFLFEGYETNEGANPGNIFVVSRTKKHSDNKKLLLSGRRKNSASFYFKDINLLGTRGL